MVATTAVRSTRLRTLTVILAGGAGGRLELLTTDRAKPAVPYAGKYRLIDFPLSNAHNAGFWVVQQFHPASIADHLANGRPWDLDRTVGGLLVLTPHLGSDRAGWHHGTADALWRHAPLIRDYAPDALVVVSADAAYRLDYGDVVARHQEFGASVTMVTTRVALDDADRYGVVEVDDSGTITGYAYKPDEPASDLVTTEVFVFDPAAVLDVLPPGRSVLTSRCAPQPAACRGRSSRTRSSARVARLRGRVERSVLGPGVVVEAGASVRESVLLHDVVVRTGASIQHAIVDAHVEIGTDAQLGIGSASVQSSDGIVVVGEGTRVADGTRIGPGTRYPEGDRHG